VHKLLARESGDSDIQGTPSMYSLQTGVTWVKVLKVHKMENNFQSSEKSVLLILPNIYINMITHITYKL
jgi:hypothetical protein